MTFSIQQKKFGSIWPKEDLVLHNFLFKALMSGSCVKPQLGLPTWLFHLINVTLHISPCMPWWQCQLNTFAHVSWGDDTSPSEVSYPSHTFAYVSHGFDTSSIEVALPSQHFSLCVQGRWHIIIWGGNANSSLLSMCHGDLTHHHLRWQCQVSLCVHVSWCLPCHRMRWPCQLNVIVQLARETMCHVNHLSTWHIHVACSNIYLFF